MDKEKPPAARSPLQTYRPPHEITGGINCPKINNFFVFCY